MTEQQTQETEGPKLDIGEQILRENLEAVRGNLIPEFEEMSDRAALNALLREVEKLTAVVQSIGIGVMLLGRGHGQDIEVIGERLKDVETWKEGHDLYGHSEPGV